MAITVLTKEDMPHSLFHPRAFEHSVGDFLSTTLARPSSNSVTWSSPLNWKARNFQTFFGVTFDSAPLDHANCLDQNFFAPLTPQHIIGFQFKVGQAISTKLEGNGKATYKPANKYNNFNNQPMLDLIEKVIDSVELEYSPENLAEIEKVKKENPDLKMQLQETFLPLKLD